MPVPHSQPIRYLAAIRFDGNCDRAPIICVAHTAGSSLLSLSNLAVASALGMTLPSWLEAATKVSELFVRANTPDFDRWAILGRAQLMQAAPVSMSAETISNRGANSSHGGRLTRKLHLAVHKLGWKLTQPCDTVRHKQPLRLSLIAAQPLASTAALGLGRASSTSVVTLPQGAARLCQSVWSGWHDDHQILI
jgi:hypothetical protein